MARIMVIASYTPSLILFREDMLREFQVLGHEVVCCSPAPDPRTLQKLEDLGVTHREFRLQRTGMNPLADLVTLRDLRRIMAEVQPDHVLSYTIKPVIYGCLAAGLQRVPAIHAMINGLGTTFQGFGLKGTLLNTLSRFMYRAALKKCRTVFFQNPDDRQLFLDGGLVDEKKTVLINGSGINLERFLPAPVPDGDPVFLLVARLVHEKGVADFVEAAGLVIARYPGARFQVAGFFDDHPRAIDRAQMDEWVKSGAIEYLGPTDDIRPLMDGCSVYCLPSYYPEGTPRTILEALATARAIITTDTPGCRETVAEGVNGWLVPARDPVALAGAMEKFCLDAGLAARMGLESRKLAGTKYDVNLVNHVINVGMGLVQTDR